MFNLKFLIRMEKAVTYSVVPRKNPKDKMAPAKFYAQAQARGEMNIREMADRIQRACTVTRADIMAVLVALSEVVADGLQDRQIVRLGDLGSLQIGLSSAGAETEDEYTSALIRKARINFRPGADLAGILPGLDYERVATKKEAEAAQPSGTPGESTPDGGNEESSDNEELV